MQFRSDHISVKCPDGPRYILKKPEKAFAIAAPDWDVRIKALVKFLDNVQVDVDAGVKKEIKSLVKDLSEKYAKLQAHYQAAYLTFWSNPCNKDTEKACQEAMASIREKDYALAAMEIKIEQLSDQVDKEKKKGKTPIKKLTKKVAVTVAKVPESLAPEATLRDTMKELNIIVSKLTL